MNLQELLKAVDKVVFVVTGCGEESHPSREVHEAIQELIKEEKDKLLADISKQFEEAMCYIEDGEGHAGNVVFAEDVFKVLGSNVDSMESQETS